MKQKVIFLVVFIFGIYLAISLSKQIWTLWQSKDRLDISQQRLEKAQTENQKLKSELENTQSDQFVEEEARNKLGMAREGEQVVILPNSVKLGEEKKAEQKKLANWQKWMVLLFD